MDAIWDCMNIASRVGKQIEGLYGLVAKTTSVQTNINPTADLQEVVVTVNAVRTTLVPFVTSAKKSKLVGDPAFDICIKGIKDTLNDLFNFLKDMEKEFSIYTWKTQKVKVFQIDFLLKQKLDQFSSLFNPNDDEKKPADKRQPDKRSLPMVLIADAEGRDMWVKSFGEQTLMVPWAVFLSTLEGVVGVPLKNDEDSLKMFLDFCKDDYVSAFEFGVFLKWFAPLRGSTQRMLEALQGGYLSGFVPAVEANLLLEGKKEGTYLVRCSKTTPGSFAVSFVDASGKVTQSLLHTVHPYGLTLKNPPTVYDSLRSFAEAHTNKLKFPLGNRWTLKNKLKGFEYDGAISQAHDNRPATTTDASSDTNTCVVCLDLPVQTVFLECGHLACCQECSGKLKQCPICRNTITRVIPIFRAT